MVIDCDLPSSFAYVLMEVSLEMGDNESGDMANWDAGMRCFLTDGITGATWRASPIMDAGAIYTVTATLKGRHYQVPTVPRKMILPGSAGGRLSVSGQNLTIDEGPMTVFFLAKFLEYDLNQAHYFAVNTPIPVR